MAFYKHVVIAGIIIVLSGTVYAAGTHSRSAKNDPKSSQEKIINTLRLMTDLMIASKDGIWKIDDKTGVSKYLKKAALKYKESMKPAMDIFEKYPELLNDKEFFIQGQKIADELVQAHQELLNSIEEWADVHGLSEAQKADLKKIIENGMDY